MVEIRNKEDLKKWLEDKPREWALAIAARAALRAIPQMSKEIRRTMRVNAWQEIIILPIIRSGLIIAANRNGLSANIEFSAVVSSSDAAHRIRGENDIYASRTSLIAMSISHVSKASYVSKKSAISSGRKPVDYATEAVSYASSATYGTYADLIWQQAERDASMLDAGQVDIWGSQLWHDNPPSDFSKSWQTLKETLLDQGSYWHTLLQWHEDRVMGDEAAARAGRPSIRAMELEIANLPDDVWSDARQANEAIKDIQDRYWGKEANKDEGEDDAGALIIPPQKPAAIEPVWRNGKLTLPGGPTDADLPGPSLEAALAALKNRLESLVEDARKVGNIDQRFVDHIESIAALVPTEKPDQTSLFELGHELETLQIAQQTVMDEWPDRLAARYAASLLAFDRTVRQFPDWRSFTQNASDIPLSDEEIEAAPEMASDVSDGLRALEATGLVAPVLPNALDHLAQPQPISEADGMLDHVPEGRWSEPTRSRLIDLIESVSNTAKALLTPILDGIKSGYGEGGILKPLGESIGKEARRVIDQAGPTLRKFLKWGGAGLFAHQLGWLEPFRPLLEKLLDLFL